MKKSIVYIFLFFFSFLFAGVAVLNSGWVENASAQAAARILFDAQPSSASSGETMVVTVSVQSDTPVNALDLRLTYPAQKLRLSSIDTSESKFSIKAEETTANGLITIARGNIEALSGTNEVAKLTFQTLRDANVSDIGFTSESIIMSEDNENVLSGSTVKTVAVDNSSDATSNGNGARQSFWDWLKNTIQSFFDRIIP